MFFFSSEDGCVYVHDLIQDHQLIQDHEMDWQVNIPCEGKDNVGTISRMEGMWNIDIAEENQIDLNNLFLSVKEKQNMFNSSSSSV